MSKYNKYKVASKHRRTYKGIIFDSIAEMNRYVELKLLEKAGKIKDLKLQPRFLLIPKTEKERACYYIADFQYEENGKTVVEDVKGARTQVYIIKRKLLRLHYQYIDFREIDAKTLR